MHTTSSTTRSTLTHIARLTVLIGGVLNGYAVRMIEAYQAGGFTGSILGITLFEIITVAISASLIASDDTVDGTGPGAVEVLAALLLLNTSSALSWLVVAGYAGHLAWRNPGPTRVGALLFLALAASCLWSSIVLKLVALPLTSLEAAAVAALLSMFKPGVTQFANVVGVPSDHSLIVMSACSFADGLARALVALAAIIVISKGDLRRQLPLAVPLLAMIYIGANLVRLTLMAWSWDYYEIGHGPMGAGLFDAVITAAIFAVALMTDRR